MGESVGSADDKVFEGIARVQKGLRSAVVTRDRASRRHRVRGGGGSSEHPLDDARIDAVNISCSRAASSRSMTPAEPAAWTISSTSNEGRPVASASACSIIAWKRVAACSRTMELGAATTPLEPETSTRTKEANHAFARGLGHLPSQARRTNRPELREVAHLPLTAISLISPTILSQLVEIDQALAKRRHQRLPMVRGEGAGLSNWVFLLVVLLLPRAACRESRLAPRSGGRGRKASRTVERRFATMVWVTADSGPTEAGMIHTRMNSFCGLMLHRRWRQG